MKLLIDENLSLGIVSFISTSHVGSAHVRDVGLARSDDADIWSHAKNHGFTIVSKDSDFRHKAFKSGPTPKVIWIARGNCTTREIVSLLQDYHSVIEDFEKNPDAAFLELG